MDVPIIAGFALILALLLLSAAVTVGWVLCLVHAARTERWGWFVVMLLFGVTAVVYFFVHFEWPGEETPRRRDGRPAGRTADEVAALRDEVRDLRQRLADPRG